MARQSFPLLAFNAGEISRLALARIDVAKMRLAAECQVNWSPWVLGPMSLRPGLLYVGETLSDAATRLIPFVFAKGDTALVEATASNLRIWIGEALLTRVSVGTAISDSTFAGGGSWVTTGTTSGCTATIAGNVATLTATAVGGLARIQQTLTIAGADQVKEHGLRIVVTDGPVTIRIGTSAGLSDVMAQTVIDTGTHSLAFTPGSGNATVVLQIDSTDSWSKTLTSCSIEAAGVVTIPTTWAAADLPNLRWDQSGDTIYVACYGQQQRKIERRGTRPGARGWSFVLYRSSNGPLFSLPGANVTMTPSVYYGNGTLTASQPYFQSGHVGALFQLFSNGQTNQAVLGAAEAYSNPVRVTGVGAISRNYGWNVSGTYVGTLTFQRSFDGPTSGFTDISTGSSGETGTPGSDFKSTTGSKAAGNPTPLLDNIIVWERIGFRSGNYTSGNATVSAGTDSGDGGSATGFNTGGGYGICRVTGYTSPTVVSIEVVQPFSSLNATTNWLESIWSGVNGWPNSVAFHEGRLWWFSGLGYAIGSQSNNYIGYASQDSFGNSLGDAGVIIEQLGAGDFDRINWGLSLRGLLLGRERSVGSARSSSFDDQPMTPTAFSVKDCSTNGAAQLPAVKLDQRGIYVQQSGRRVYELGWSPQKFDYAARDLTRLNTEIGKPLFNDLAVRRQPDSEIHLPRLDGQVAVLLDDEDDEVVGWWRIATLGVVENVAVLPGSDIEDIVYYVVKRTINGGTKRFIEKLALRDDCVGGSTNKQADAAYVYSGSPISTAPVTWLPSTSVIIWADGQSRGTATSDGSGNVALGASYSNVVVGLGGATVSGSFSGAGSNTLTVGSAYNGYPAEVFADIGATGRGPIHIGSLTVSGGAVTLPNNQLASSIVAYLGYVAPFQSAKLAFAAQLGAPLTQRKRIDHIGLVMQDTQYQALSFGQRHDTLDSLPLLEADNATAAGTVWREYDEPPIELPGEWATDARLCLLAAAPNPVTINAVVLPGVVNEK